MSEDKYPAFKPIPRLLRDVVVTEKIDGTNALVSIDAEGNIRAGSRSTWITPEKDNFGFARWVEENKETLALLGEGNHYGEWWGAGVQRRYGLDHKRFSLFNTHRWTVEEGSTVCIQAPCCHVVPVLSIRTLDTNWLRDILEDLSNRGSRAAPGFMKPEGIVAYHTKSDQYFKVTLDKNDGHKGS